MMDWLKRIRECEIDALKSFVNGLESDLDIVKAVQWLYLRVMG